MGALDMYASRDRMRQMHEEAQRKAQQEAMKQPQGDALIGTIGSIAGTAVAGPVGGAVGGSLGSHGDLSQVTPEKVAMNVATSQIGNAMDSVKGMDTETMDFIKEMDIEPDSEFGQAIMEDSANQYMNDNPFMSTVGQIGNKVQSGIDSVKGQFSALGDSVSDNLGKLGDNITGVLSPAADLVKQGFADMTTGAQQADAAVKNQLMPNQMVMNPISPFNMNFGTPFNRGGPVSYSACGGKMKYRADGSEEPETAAFSAEQDPKNIYGNIAQNRADWEAKKAAERQNSPFGNLFAQMGLVNSAGNVRPFNNEDNSGGGKGGGGGGGNAMGAILNQPQSIEDIMMQKAMDDMARLDAQAASFSADQDPEGFYAADGGYVDKYAQRMQYNPGKFTLEQDPKGIYQNQGNSILSSAPTRETNPVTTLSNGMTYDRASMFAGQGPGTFTHGLVSNVLAMQPEYSAEGGSVGESALNKYMMDTQYQSKYRADGGPISSSQLEAQAIALNNDEALKEAMRMQQLEAQYNAFNIDPEELARREAEMKRRMMQEEMYERNKRAHEAAGEGYYFGPLKSTQYKSAGGEVYTQNYYNPKEK